MKTAISNLAWQPHEDPAAYALLQASGVALEAASGRLLERPFDQSPAAWQALRADLDGHGQRLVSLQSLLFSRPDLVLFGDEAGRKALAAYLEKGMDFAAALGARVLVFGSPKNRLRGSLDEEAARALAAEFFRRQGDQARARGVVLCLEAVPREYGADFLCTTAEAAELVNMIDHPHVGLNLDLGAMTLNQEPYERIADWAPRIGHVHLSEPGLQPVPRAETPHVRIAGILRDAGFDGFCSAEMLAPSEHDNLDALRRAIRFMEETYS